MPTLIEKLQLARELGVSVEINRAETLISQQKIDGILKGMPYYEVTNEDLEHLFKIDVINTVVRTLTLSLPLVLAGLFSWWCIATHNGIAGMVIFDVVILLMGYCIMIQTASALSVELKRDALSSTTMPIPYGAMLRVKEAKETGVFDSFSIVYPGLRRRVFSDPAIVGHSKDGRQMMIVYWDIKKDVERTLKEIRKNFPLKLS